MLCLVIENVSKCWSPFLLSISQMMALIRSLVRPTIWGNCARWMFKFYGGYIFPCSSEIFLKISLKIRIKVLSHPSGIELTSSTNTLGTNSIPKKYLYRHDYHHNLPPLTTHLASGSPTPYPRWLPTGTYTIWSAIQKYYFLINHNKSSITLWSLHTKYSANHEWPMHWCEQSVQTYYSPSH